MNALALASIDTFRNGVWHLDAATLLRSLPENSVHCIVTSPPYYGLRDYSADGQIGLEDTPDQYVARLVALFELARRALRDDGTLWLNLGDSYAGSSQTGGTNSIETGKRKARMFTKKTSTAPSRKFRLRQDLSPKEVTYVLEELAKARKISTLTVSGDE